VASLLWSLRSRWVTVGGVLLGGSTANLLDLSVHGVVWNMVPLPFSDIWCNG
jgi:lipoprotein signal peptidase